MFKQSNLAQPISNHTMISYFRSHDPNPTLYPRCTKYFRSHHSHSPCNIKYTLDRSIPKKPFSCTLGPLLFSSLYSFWPSSIPQTKTILRARGLLGRDQITITLLNIVG